MGSLNWGRGEEDTGGRWVLGSRRDPHQARLPLHAMPKPTTIDPYPQCHPNCIPNVGGGVLVGELIEEDGPYPWSGQIEGQVAHIESRMSRSRWVGWTGLGWATPGGGQARIRSHRPLRGWVGGVDRSL